MHNFHICVLCLMHLVLFSCLSKCVITAYCPNLLLWLWNLVHLKLVWKHFSVISFYTKFIVLNINLYNFMLKKRILCFPINITFEFANIYIYIYSNSVMPYFSSQYPLYTWHWPHEEVSGWPCVRSKIILRRRWPRFWFKFFP